MPSPLEAEFKYFLAHQDELVAKYNGKYVVIKGERVLGAYDDQPSAIAETRKQHELGSFLVQKAGAGK